MTDDAGCGEKMNEMPKYVVSETLSGDAADWNKSTVIRGDVAGEISKLKPQVDGDILVAEAHDSSRRLPVTISLASID